jgi:hypothetical protein
MDKRIIEIAVAAFVGILLGCFAGFVYFNMYYLTTLFQSDVVKIQAISQPNQHQSSQHTGQYKAQVQAKVAQIKASPKVQQAQSHTTSSSNHQQSESQNDILINELVEAVNKIPATKESQGSQELIEKAGQAFKKFQDYNEKNPQFAAQLTQKQKDVVSEHVNKLSQFENLGYILSDHKTEGEQPIEKFIKSVNEIPFGDNKNPEYKEKLDRAISFFKEYMKDLKYQKMPIDDQFEQYKNALKKLFGSLTREQVLQYGLKDYSR